MNKDNLDWLGLLLTGQYGPGIALIAASYTGCNQYLTVAILTLGVGLNGGIYSGFKVNHLDISPRFAGILMSFTNCMANLAGLLAPLTAGYIIHGRVRFDTGSLKTWVYTRFKSFIVLIPSLNTRADLERGNWHSCSSPPRKTKTTNMHSYNYKNRFNVVQK